MQSMNFDKIELSKEGVWLHEGVEVTHARTVKVLFESVYYKNGKYYLSGEKVPVPIQVGDVAFFVRSLSKNKTGYKLKLSNGKEEHLDITSLNVGHANELYCRIQHGTTPAKFERKVYYELMKQLTQQDGYYGIVVDGRFYPVHSVKRAKEAEEALKTAQAKGKSAKKAVKKPVEKKTVAKKTVKKKAVKKKPAKKVVKKKAAKKKVVKKKTVKKKTVKKAVKKKIAKKKTVKKKTKKK